MPDVTADEKHQTTQETPDTMEGQKVDNRHIDAAAAYLNNTEQYEPLTPDEEKKVLRKTDLILLPMVGIPDLADPSVQISRTYSNILAG